MYRLVNSKQGLGVVQVSDNGRVIAENYGFSSVRAALKNIWARVNDTYHWTDANIKDVEAVAVYFQDDRSNIPQVYLVDFFLKKNKVDVTPHKRYVPKIKK